MAGAHLLDDVPGFCGEVGREVESGVEDFIDGSLAVLGTKWRLREKNTTDVCIILVTVHLPL